MLQLLLFPEWFKFQIVLFGARALPSIGGERYAICSCCCWCLSQVLLTSSLLPLVSSDFNCHQSSFKSAVSGSEKWKSLGTVSFSPRAIQLDIGSQCYIGLSCLAFHSRFELNSVLCFFSRLLTRETTTTLWRSQPEIGDTFDFRRQSGPWFIGPEWQSHLSLLSAIIRLCFEIRITKLPKWILLLCALFFFSIDHNYSACVEFVCALWMTSAAVV